MVDQSCHQIGFELSLVANTINYLLRNRIKLLHVSPTITLETSLSPATSGNHYTTLRVS